MFDTKPANFGGYVYGSCGQPSASAWPSAWPSFDDCLGDGDGDSCAGAQHFDLHFDLPPLENIDDIELPMLSPHDPQAQAQAQAQAPCAALQQWGMPTDGCGSSSATCGQHTQDLDLDFSSIWDESVKLELPELNTSSMYANNNNGGGGGMGGGMDTGMDTGMDAGPSPHNNHTLVFPTAGFSAGGTAQGLDSAVAVRVTKIVSTRFPQCGRKDWFDLKLNLRKDPFTGEASVSLSQIRAVLCQKMHQPIEFDEHSLVVLKIKRRHLVGGDRGQRKTELSKQKVAFQQEWGWHQLASSTADDRIVVDPAEDLLYITAQCHCGKLVTSEMTKLHPNHRYCRQHVKCMKTN